MSKRIYIDTETGGLDCKTCALIQIGGVIVVDEHVVDVFKIDIKPAAGKTCSKEALKVTGLDPTQGISSVQAFKLFIETLERFVDREDRADKYQLYGYNVTFDDGFLREFFKDNGAELSYSQYFWNPAIDVMSLAHEAFGDKRHVLPNFKLKTVARALGVELENAHDALADAIATSLVHERIRNENPN